MCQFIETIRIERGVVYNLDYHRANEQSVKNVLGVFDKVCIGSLLSIDYRLLYTLSFLHSLLVAGFPIDLMAVRLAKKQHASGSFALCDNPNYTLLLTLYQSWSHIADQI